MEDKEIANFVILMNGIFEVYGEHPSDIKIKTFFKILKPYPFQEISSAMYKYVADPELCRFPPKPGDIVALINPAGLSAEEAWGKLVDGIRKHGIYKSVVFDDPVLMYVVDLMGGWKWFCAQNKENMSFVKKEFLKNYKEAKIKDNLSYPPVLEGIVGGKKNIVSIGNREECKKIFLNPATKRENVIKQIEGVTGNE